MSWKIWHANDLNAAEWFIAGTSVTDIDWEPKIIPRPGSAEFLNLPEVVKHVLRLEAPDLIATFAGEHGDEPIISIELTTTTPQSHHAKQRMPRLVAAAEADVPCMYIIPERKRSGGSQYSVGPDLYFWMNRVREINNVPVFVYHYPDIDGVLVHDPTFPNQPRLGAPAILQAFRTIRTIIDIKRERSPGPLMNDPWIKEEIERHDLAGSEANVRIENFTTLKEIQTAELGDFLEASTQMGRNHIEQTIEGLPSRIMSREQTIVFQPGGRLLAHANDPYSGMFSFFDYAFCRTGRSVERRNKNLVYMPMKEGISNLVDEFSPAGYGRYWRDTCPFRSNEVPSVEGQFKISHNLQYGCVFTKIKPMRVLGYFSDMIVFQDSVLVF